MTCLCILDAKEAQYTPNWQKKLKVEFDQFKTRPIGFSASSEKTFGCRFDPIAGKTGKKFGPMKHKLN